MTVVLTLLFGILISFLGMCIVHEKWKVHRQAHRLGKYLDPDSLSLLIFSWAKGKFRQRRRSEDDVESNHVVLSQMIRQTNTAPAPPMSGLPGKLSYKHTTTITTY